MMIIAKSKKAQQALESVEELQHYFVQKLNSITTLFGDGGKCKKKRWLRDDGLHGGGSRYMAHDRAFNGASVNVSQVHYNDNPKKKLSSATALSTIIHPDNPFAPSMHMHISWTEMRDGHGYWRIMADLNPSIANKEDKRTFNRMLKSIAGVEYEKGIAQGERYFYIPVVKRTRGISHFYLEEFYSGDFKKDKKFAFEFAKHVIDVYIEIISFHLVVDKKVTKADKKKQLSYHTLYLLQVLTLDRGTTSGLLIHNQNDIGIMGSLPAYVDREILESIIPKMPKPQNKLLKEIVKVLPHELPTAVNKKTRKALAKVVREHYKKHPEALTLQASGDIVPPTVKNHK